jgi:hypothetical protein
VLTGSAPVRSWLISSSAELSAPVSALTAASSAAMMPSTDGEAAA